MESDSSTPEETVVAEVAGRVLNKPLEELSGELRGFLADVVELHPDADKAVDWLEAKNNALQGQSPISMIRSEKIQELNDFWNTYRRIHGS